MQAAHRTALCQQTTGDVRQLSRRDENAEVEPVIAYIDGYNFYHGLMDKGWGRYRWLDYRALMTKYLRDDQQLVAVKLFTVLRSHPPERYKRHKVYLDALTRHSQVETIYGKHHLRPITCPLCDGQWDR